MLHDISIYRIDIEYELNIDYEYLLKPTSNNIENRYRAQILRYSDIELHSAKIHERIMILVTLLGCLGSFWNVGAKPIISKIEFERADIESNPKF